MSFLGAWALVGALPAMAADTHSLAHPDNTWVALGALPAPLQAPVFAIAADPGNPAVVLVGTGAGTIYRSTDGGGTWAAAGNDLGRGVLTLQFSPFKPGTVYAGTRGAGTFRSADGGASWTRLAGIPNTTVRSFGFAKSMTLVGTDGGLYSSRDGATWSPYLSFAPLSLSAIAVAAVNDPPRFLAGADASRAEEVLPLYFSVDGGTSWANVRSLGSSTIVATAAAGAAPPNADSRPVLVGTNAGAFMTLDGGTTWNQESGLPATDFTSSAFLANHTDRFYLASDGSGGASGGLWTTTDSGQTFRSLAAPIGAVTAFALTAEETPTVYSATFRSSDQAVMLWAYRDAGGAPVAPLGGVPGPAPKVAAAANNRVTASPTDPRSILTGAEGPYLGLGLLSVLVLLAAIVLQVRKGREN